MKTNRYKKRFAFVSQLKFKKVEHEPLIENNTIH